MPAISYYAGDARTIEDAYRVLIHDLRIPLCLPQERATTALASTSRQVHADLKRLLDEFPAELKAFIGSERRRQAGLGGYPSGTKASVLWEFSQRLKDFIQDKQRHQERLTSVSDPDLLTMSQNSRSTEATLIEDEKPDAKWLEKKLLVRPGSTDLQGSTVIDLDDLDSLASESDDDDPKREPSPTPDRSRAMSSPKRPASESSLPLHDMLDQSPSKRRVIDLGRCASDDPSAQRRIAPFRHSGSDDTSEQMSRSPSIEFTGGTQPTTPQRRPATGETGMTGPLGRLELKTPKLGQVAPSPFSIAKAVPEVDLSGYDPAHPLVAPGLDERYLEVIPRNPYQAQMNRKGINYYVQWGLSLQMESHEAVDWRDINVSDLDLLIGTPSKILPRISHVLDAVAARKRGECASDGQLHPDFPSETSSSRMLAEMDMEEVSINDVDLRGVGNDSQTWPYGGSLVFAVAVRRDNVGIRPMQVTAVDQEAADNPYRRSPTKAMDPPSNPFGARAAAKSAPFPFRFQLLPFEPPTKSTRLARRFGSRRVLTIRFSDVPRDQRPRLFRMLLGRALVLFGRVFRVIHAPADADHATAIQTNEAVPNTPSAVVESGTMSFLELLSAFNGLDAKPSQAMAKWASRMQLLLSDSVPAVRVDPAHITTTPDMVCDSAKDPDNPATTEILTDGCGLMSEDLARQIALHPNFSQRLTGRPYVVQMRCGGAKGLLAVMSPEQRLQYPNMDVVLRDSMVKSYPDDKSKAHLDPALCTLDVCRVDGLNIGTNISSEPIIIMEHNGVPSDLLLAMAEESIDMIRRAFIPKICADVGEDERGMRDRLIAAIWRFGGVGQQRKRRECIAQGLSTKVAGLSIESTSVSVSDSSDVFEFGDPDVSKEEQLYNTLLAGYTPTPMGASWAAGMLRCVVKSLADNAVTDIRISVDQSATAMIVPDTLGVLAPDEIFVSFSADQPVDPVTLRRINFLEGDVLIYRSPCKLPTDVRKLKAVVRPELFHLRDCIVLSANSKLCTASPASFLGGGDYDGDTATVIWDERLVTPFTNAPDEMAFPPETFEQDNFVKKTVSVREILDAVGTEDEAAKIMNVQYFLLANMLDQHLTGIYSGLHDKAVYHLGCAHPDTIRLAHMFCHVLDARKSGLTLLPDLLSKDSRAIRGTVWWRWTKKGSDKTCQDNVIFVERAGPRAFIMDRLLESGRTKTTEIMSDFPDPAKGFVGDNDLVGLSSDFTRILEFAKADQARRPQDDQHDAELNRHINNLVGHVLACIKLWQRVMSNDTTPMFESYRRLRLNLNDPQPTGGKKGEVPNSVVAARKRELAAVWRTFPDMADVARIVPFGDPDALATLKLACLVHYERHGVGSGPVRPVKVAFEVDLAGVCAMKARSLGATTILPARAAARLKPTWSYDPAVRGGGA